MEISSSLPMGKAIFNAQVAVAVQKIAMDNFEQSSDQLRKMMESSLMPNLGGNIDFKV